MHDGIQQGLETLATGNMAAREVAIICATVLPYLLGAAWLIVAAWHRARLSAAIVVRWVMLAVLAYLAAKVLTSLVLDPRPYLVSHIRPLAPVARDNGFPSDHTLLAAALTAALWWLDRRLIAAFAAGTLLVMVGRLAIGAHHTLDVLGSVAIVLVAAFIAGAVPLPGPWARPLLPARLGSGTRELQRPSMRGDHPA